MNLAPIFLIGLPVLLVLTVGLLSSTRRLGFWLGVLTAIVLTPIGGTVLAVLSGPRTRRRSKKPHGMEKAA